MEKDGKTELGPIAVIGDYMPRRVRPYLSLFRLQPSIFGTLPRTEKRRPSWAIPFPGSALQPLVPQAMA